MDMKDIEFNLDEIKKRNRRVEADKAWETSTFRRILIAVITYALIVLFMYSSGIGRPLLSAIVPTAGYLLSTLSLPFVKRWWISRRRM